MKTIEVIDFSGGENRYFQQLVIDQSEHASGSQNIWTYGGALTRIPGTTEWATFTASAGNVTLRRIHVDDSTNQSYPIYGYISYTTAVDSSASSLWGVVTALTSAVPLGYVTGSVSISGATKISATGSGTSWSTHVSAGDKFRIDSSATAWYNVASVEDATHLTLSSAVPVAVATGSAYTVRLMQDTKRFAVASFNGSIFACSTGNVLQQYDGSNVLRGTGGPAAAMLTPHKNYLFAFRTNANESRLSWSAIKNGTSWPSSNFIDIDVKRGKGSGMISYGNELVLFKNRGMFILHGDVFDPSNPTYYIRPIAVEPSFIFNCPNAMTIHKGALYFYSHGVVYKYLQGTGFITPISLKWQYDFPTSFAPITDLNTADWDVYMASYGDFIAMKVFTSGKTGNPAGGLISEDGKWWYWEPNLTTSDDGTRSGPFAILNKSSARPKLLMSIEQGAIVEWDYVNRDVNNPEFPVNTEYYATTSPYENLATTNAIYVSKEFNVDYATFKEIIIYHRKQTAGNLTFQYSIDQGSFTSVSVDMTTGRGQMIRSTIPINQKGSTIQVKFSNATFGQTFLIYGYRINYEPIPEDRKS